MNYRFILYLILLQLLQINGYSNNANLSYLEKNRTDKIFKNENPNLFLHVDKTIYTNNEQIWFTGYLLSNNFELIEAHTFLTVYLTRENTDNTILEHRFIIENGISYGNILLPDTIPPGNYFLKAYTNIIDGDKKPICTFAQRITIKSLIENTIQANISVNSSNNSSISNTKIEIETNEIKGDNIIVSFLNYDSKFQAIGKSTNNKYHVEIPIEDLKKYGSELLISVRKGKEIKYVYAKLPIEKSKEIYINFYPEGGTLASGVVNLVAWEATASNGNPINTTAVLLRNNEVIDTIRTEYYGLGKFKFIPTVNDTYSVKIFDSLSRISKNFPLPKATNIGLNINIKKSVVNDTLDVNLVSKLKQRITLLIHNNHEVFTRLPLALFPGILSFKIDLKAMQKGIGTITILDSLHRPILERLFFSHYDEKIKAALHTDKEYYKATDSVRVNINISNEKFDKPVAGLVSVAVIQNNRIETNKELNIESYQFLTKELNNISSLEATLVTLFRLI